MLCGVPVVACLGWWYLCGAVYAGWLLTSPPAAATPQTWWPPHDFVEYYSAARVWQQGGNPYQGQSLLPIQQALLQQPDKIEATMLWTPPWTLPLYAPLGWFAPDLAQGVWALLQVMTATLGALGIWNGLDVGTTPKSRRYRMLVPLGVMLTTGTFYWNLGYGQNTGYLILGLGGYLWCLRLNRPFAAGMIGALTAVKPHLFVLFALMILCNGRTTAGRRVLAGGALMILLGSMVAMLPQRGIFQCFLTAMQQPTNPTTTNLADWQLPLLSYHFRWAIEPTQFRWQFLPIGLAALGYLVVRFCRRATAPMEVEVPWVVLISLLLAPYGGWSFDLLALLVVSMRGFQVAASAPRRALVVAFAILGHLTILRYTATIGYLQEGWWVTPAVAVWWGVVSHFASTESESES